MGPFTIVEARELWRCPNSSFELEAVYTILEVKMMIEETSMFDGIAHLLNILILMGIAFIVVESLMILFWGIFLVHKQVKVVDIGWGLSFILANTTYFIFGNGFLWRKLLILLLVSIWALRLVYYLVDRFKTERDDPRYLLILETWKDSFLMRIKSMNLRVLFLFLMQGLIVTVLSLPFAIMNTDTLFFFEPTEVFGLLIWMVGLVGESVADQQLFAFKNNPANATQVCQEGLWKFSRHPNYFFEWVIWIGYCMMAFASPWGWLSIISPLFILYLLLKVSGIPLAEAESLRTKGDAYRDYQARTSVFIPWFRK